MGVKKTVAIFGGGIGGLSAAHELVDGQRGDEFQVTVYEALPVYGGKAASNWVTGVPPEASGRKPYPGEHGFRFFPTFYRHVIDTMHRIPSQSRSPDRPFVDLHLQPTPTRMLARYDHAPIIMPTAPSLLDPAAMIEFFLSLFGADTGLTPDDVTHFVLKLLQLATSCKERRIAEYETQSWWDFMDAGNRSEAFKRYLAKGLTRSLVAADPTCINAKTGGDVLVRLLIDSSIPEIKASADRVLDGPTSEVWIDPWHAYLSGSRGVAFHQATLEAFELGAPGTVSRAWVSLPGGGRTKVEADYFIMAVPVEATATILDSSPAVLAASAMLRNVRDFLTQDVRSMTGAQFYLNQPLDLPDHTGHALYPDAPWALTSIAQSDFWRAPFDDRTAWGAGDIKTVLSVIVADWTTKCPDDNGIVAELCSLEQLRELILQQLERSLNGDETTRFDRNSVVAWNLDASVTPSVNGVTPAVNTKYLLINKPARWQYRPEAALDGLSNLMLAADYVRTTTDLATMEGANEAARRAVNAILDRTGSTAPRCQLFELYYPDVLLEHLPWLAFDKALFAAGQDWSATRALLLAHEPLPALAHPDLAGAWRDLLNRP